MFFIFLLSGTAFCQDNGNLIHAYWGNVSDIVMSPEQVLKINQIIVKDTIKGHQISQVSKFRFLMQPIMEGPVKAAFSSGPYFDQTIKGVMGTPQPGDKIMLTEIFANVDNQGTRQIPTAVVITIQ